MKKIILMGVPHHGNIGDNAISIAEENMIKKYFPKLDLIQLPEKNLIEEAEKIRNLINDDDVILLHGGGNIGDTYFVPEEGRRFIIKTFPNNKIIVFPQTAYFDSLEELEKSKEIYNAHKNLIIMAREEKTFDFMKKKFNKCKIYLTPDIVFSMKMKMNLERKNVLFLFRNDKEKTMNVNEQEQIKDIIIKKYGGYILSDMHLGEDVTDMQGQKKYDVVKSKFEQFNKSKLVVTDRLHGMIFAAITETPCVVVGSYTHKTIESYKWIKNLEYIKFCNNIENIEEDIQSVMESKNIKYDNTFAEELISKILLDEIQ